MLYYTHGETYHEATMPDVTLTTLEGVTVTMPLAQFNAEKEAAVSTALAEANATIARLTEVAKQAHDAANNADRTYDALRTSIEEHLGIPHNASIYEAIKAIKDENAALKQRIAELTSPPVVVPEKPEPETPQRAVFPFCAVYIEDEAANNDPAQAQARFNRLLPVMEFAAECDDITDYVMFGNTEDVKYKHLFLRCNSLGKRYWQSPIQAYYVNGAVSQTPFIEHLQKLHQLGVYGAIIDDAQNIPAAEMPRMLDLINKHMPGAPVMASFLASFDDIAEGYPHERYIDMRQWFLRGSESPAVWFEKWETAHDAQVWAADCYRRKGGFMHTPASVKTMFEIALPMIQGIAWYSLYNKETNHMLDALDPKQAHVRSMWSVIKECSALYQQAWTAARLTR